MPLAHEIGGLAQDFRPVIGRGRAPHGEALLGRFQRAIEIGRAGMRQMRQRLFRRRIDHVLAAAAVAIEPLTVDVKFQIGVHEGPLWGFSRKGDSRRLRPDFRFFAGAVSLAEGCSRFPSRVHPRPRMPPIRSIAIGDRQLLGREQRDHAAAFVGDHDLFLDAGGGIAVRRRAIGLEREHHALLDLGRMRRARPRAR